MTPAIRWSEYAAEEVPAFYDCTVPFVAAGYRYATDGRIAIRLYTGEDEADAPEPETGCRRPPVAAQFRRDWKVRKGVWRPLPAHPGPTLDVECPACAGSGRAPGVCPTCGGRGELPYRGVAVDCAACEGGGSIVGEGPGYCPECGGIGATAEPLAVRLAGRYFAGGYYALMAALPWFLGEDAVVYLDDPDAHARSPLPFAWGGGGEGLLMPLDIDGIDDLDEFVALDDTPPKPRKETAV